MNTPTVADSRFGIIRKIDEVTVPRHFGRSFVMRRAWLCDSQRFSPWPSDSGGAGYAFSDDDAALGAAIGEAVERYCGNVVGNDVVWDSYTGLHNSGVYALRPDKVALFSEEQYSAEGFPFVPFTRDLQCAWTKGTDLATGDKIMVPASLVWVSIPGRVAPHTNPIIQAGLAAGRSRQEAELSALHEVIERDTMALTWTGRGSLRQIRPPLWLQRLAKGQHNAFHTRFLDFPNEFGLRVIGALIYDSTTGYLSLGMGCRSDATGAMLKALGEAFQLQLFVAGYDSPGGPYMQVASNPRSPLKPWRKKRDYSRAYREDFRDVNDYGCHLQMFLDPVFQERFEAELATAISTEIPFAELPDEPGLILTALVDRLSAANYEVISVDVTTPDVAVHGLSVVRVLVPGVYSNSAAGLPFLGGNRLAHRLAETPHGTPRSLPMPH